MSLQSASETQQCNETQTTYMYIATWSIAMKSSKFWSALYNYVHGNGGKFLEECQILIHTMRCT